MFVGRRTPILRLPECFRQAIQHPVFSLMGIRVFSDKFLKYFSNTRWSIRCDLVTDGEMQAQLQERVRFSVLGFEACARALFAQSGLVFGVIRDNLRYLCIKREKNFATSRFAPGIDIHLPQFLSVLRTNHGVSVFCRYSHRSMIIHRPHSGLRALQIYRPCNISQ